MFNGAALGNLLILAVPLLLIAWMIFAQRKRARDVQSLQGSLSVGDEVCTTSGMFGTITSLDDATATLEISPGVQVRYDRRAIGLKAVPNAVSTASSETLHPTPSPGE